MSLCELLRHEDLKHEQPILLRNEVSKFTQSSSSSAVQPPPQHLFACSLLKRGQKHCRVTLLSEGKVVPLTHIFSALLHCHHYFDFSNFSIRKVFL